MSSDEMYKTYQIISPESEYFSEEEDYLRYLLCENEILLSARYKENEAGNIVEQEGVSLLVICNDVFAWGCADAEEIMYSDLGVLARLSAATDWGTAAWCVAKRKYRPQSRVEELMTEAGWDIDKLLTLDPMDTEQAFTSPAKVEAASE